jgi:hypothetical protein
MVDSAQGFFVCGSPVVSTWLANLQSFRKRASAASGNRWADAAVFHSINPPARKVIFFITILKERS